MIQRRTDITLSVAIFWFSVLGSLSISAQTADVDVTPTQATVYVGQCTQFYVTISPAQPSTVDISIEYSDPSRLSYVTTGFPIYPPGTSQYFSVCGRVAGTEPITITAALPAAFGGARAYATADVINPVPEPWNMWPTSALAGSGPLSLTFGNGANSLSSASQVLWNGEPRETVFEVYPICQVGCPSWIRATIPASDLAIPGSAIVTVVNPPPGGGPSRPYTFTILPGLQSQSVPLLSPGMVALLALLLAAAGTYILRNGGGT